MQTDHREKRELSAQTMRPFITMFMRFTIIYFRAGATANKNKNYCKLYVFILTDLLHKESLTEMSFLTALVLSFPLDQLLISLL
jgi:hypothetical protein